MKIKLIALTIVILFTLFLAGCLNSCARRDEILRMAIYPSPIGEVWHGGTPVIMFFVLNIDGELSVQWGTSYGTNLRATPFMMGPPYVRPAAIHTIQLSDYEVEQIVYLAEKVHQSGFRISEEVADEESFTWGNYIVHMLYRNVDFKQYYWNAFDDHSPYLNDLVDMILELSPIDTGLRRIQL